MFLPLKFFLGVPFKILDQRYKIKIISANLLHFKPIFDSSLNKVVSKPSFAVESALVRLNHSVARVKIWGRSTPQGPKYVFPNNAFLVKTIQHRDLQGRWT